MLVMKENAPRSFAVDRQHPDKLIKKTDRRSSGRRGARRNTRAACRAGKIGMGRNIAVEVLDVSETGIRLRVKQECADNAEVQVQLGSPGLPRSITVTGKVVWCI